MAKLSKVQQRLNKINKFNNFLKQHKYIHLMFNDKFAVPVVQFFNTHFTPQEHLFLCKRTSSFPFPTAQNVIEVDTFKDLNCEAKVIKKVFCHSLFDKELVQLLYDTPKLLEKAYWIVWGGDLYNAPRDEVNDYVRSNVRGYIICQQGDGKVVQERYTCKYLSFCLTGYSTPLSLDLINQIKKDNENKQGQRNNIVIQVNNSADSSTLEILDILAKFKDQNIIIRTPLSYGDPTYLAEIVNKGNLLFGDKFQILNRFFPPEEYAKLLSEVDVYIFNQNRSQGMGNCVAALLFGAKIFIRSDVMSYKRISNYATIYDTKTIESLSFHELIAFPEEKKNENIKRVEVFYNDQTLKDAWLKALAMP